MTNLDRRELLTRGAAGSMTAFGGLGLFAARAADAKKPGENLAAPDNGGYGPLQPDPRGVLALPAGFGYVRFGETGQPMSDGTPTPRGHDGMAAFSGEGSTVRLVRNHELGKGAPFGLPAYDETAQGGTTNLVYDTAKRELVASYASLTGTVRNCAGGPTPWGSWISCEETTNDQANGGYSRPHGYNFEVDARATSPEAPVPLKAMGRFVHEAVAIDPASGIVYETEDRGTSGFYRFLPSDPGNLAAGGRLQMLAIKARDNYDTRTGQRVGKPLPVTWVDIDEPDPATAGTNPSAVFEQGFAKGGATFARLEGAWYGDGSIFINATSGGDKKLGQVWEYRPRGQSGGQLILTFESTDEALLQAPDNITVSPRGGLLLCEDGGGTDFLRGVTQEGRIFDFARNDLNASEFAGATFSPDGNTLFVNIQSPGISFAITGPFERGEL